MKWAQMKHHAQHVEDTYEDAEAWADLLSDGIVGAKSKVYDRSVDIPGRIVPVFVAVIRIPGRHAATTAGSLFTTPWLDDSGRILKGEHAGQPAAIVASMRPGYVGWILSLDLADDERAIFEAHMARAGQR